jgi:hypothetical protein
MPVILSEGHRATRLFLFPRDDGANAEILQYHGDLRMTNYFERPYFALLAKTFGHFACIHWR